MNYMITGRNIDVTEGLRTRIEEKFDKLAKFLNDDTHVHVTMNVQKLEQKLEVTIPVKGTILRTEVKEHDMYAAIDKAVDILDKQLMKYKSKLKDKHKHDNSFKADFLEGFYHEEDHDDEEVHKSLKIAKTKTFDVKPMNVTEAIMQMDLLGHDFFVFKSDETDKISVVYKRKGDTYGLINAEY